MPAFMREHMEREYQWHCERVLKHAKAAGLITPEEEPSEAKRIEWAKKFVAESKYSANLLVDNFELVEIHDQQAFIDIARILAQQSGWRVAHLLSNAKIVEEKIRIELAKLVASEGEDAHHLPGQIDSYEIRDQKVLVDLATQLFAKYPNYVGQNFANFKIQDEAIRIRFAKDYAEYVEWAMSEMILEFDLHDQPTLIEIVTKNIMREDNAVAYNIQNFRIESVDERIKIAKVLAQKKPIDLMRNFEKFDISNEKVRFEIAKIAFNSKDHSLAEYIHVFDLPNEDYRIELAKISALVHANDLCRYISFFKITSEDSLAEIAKVAAQQDPKSVSEHIKQFKIQDEAKRFEVAKTVAAQSSSEFSKHYEKFGIENPEYHLALAKIAAANDAYFVSAFEAYKITNLSDRLMLAKIYAAFLPKNAIQSLKNFMLDENGNKEVLKIATFADGITIQYAHSLLQQRHREPQFLTAEWTQIFLDGITRSPNNKLLSYEERLHHFDQIRRDVEIAALTPYLGRDTALIGSFAKHHDMILDVNNPLPQLSKILSLRGLERFIPLLSDRSRHAAVQIKLFQQIWKIQFGDHQQYKARLEARMDSLNLVEVALGLPERCLDAWAKLSKDRRNTFYELSLEIAELQPGLFLDFPHIRDLLAKKQNEYILGLIRDNLALSATSELMEIFKTSDEKQMSEQLAALFSERMKQLFAELNLAIQYDEFLALKKRWGNLEPVLTLMARFKGNHQWQNELPWLGRVFTAEILDQFAELKFSKGFDEKDAQLLKRQLDFLDDQQKAEWQKMRQVARAYDISSAAETAEDLGQRRTTITGLRTQLGMHLHEAANGKVPESNGDQIRKVYIKKQDPIKSLESLLEHFSEEEIIWTLTSDFMATGLSIKNTDSDLEETKSALIFLNANLAQLIKAPHIQVQAREDLKELLSYFRKPEERKNERMIVYTTLIQDGRSLLTIGDLVEASSCQNYKTGSHIETLLGYVLDANVQGIASFVLSQSHFSSPKEFQAAYEAVEINPDNIRMDPYTHTFTIKTAVGEIQSAAVKKAHHRQILKLGKTESKKPGLRLERAYQQNHLALRLMAEQAQVLKDTVGTAIGAEEGEITIPQSRNPGGVYSDACSGVMTNSYKIQ